MIPDFFQGKAKLPDFKAKGFQSQHFLSLCSSKSRCIKLFLFFRLTFQYVPSSTVYGFDAVDLKPNGANEVTFFLNQRNLTQIDSIMILLL